jgi:hypothetical protein
MATVDASTSNNTQELIGKSADITDRPSRMSTVIAPTFDIVHREMVASANPKETPKFARIYTYHNHINTFQREDVEHSWTPVNVTTVHVVLGAQIDVDYNDLSGCVLFNQLTHSTFLAISCRQFSAPGARKEANFCGE